MSGRPSDTVVQENPGKSGITPKLPDRPVAQLQTGSPASVRSWPIMRVSEQIEPRQLTRVARSLADRNVFDGRRRCSRNRSRTASARVRYREFMQLRQSGTLAQDLPPFAFDTVRAAHSCPFSRWTSAASARETSKTPNVRLPDLTGRNSDAASQGRMRPQFPAMRVPSSLRRS